MLLLSNMQAFERPSSVFQSFPRVLSVFGGISGFFITLLTKISNMVFVSHSLFFFKRDSAVTGRPLAFVVSNKLQPLEKEDGFIKFQANIWLEVSIRKRSLCWDLCFWTLLAFVSILREQVVASVKRQEGIRTSLEWWNR